MKSFGFIILFLYMFSSTLFAEDLDSLRNDIKSYKSTFSRDATQYDFDTLKALSERFQKLTKKIHKVAIRDISNSTPLSGGQLTNLHMLVSMYIDISYQFERRADISNNTFLSLMFNFERLRLAGNTYLPIFSNKKLRRLLNAEDKSFNISKRELRKHLLQLIDKPNLELLRKKILNSHALLNPSENRTITSHSVYQKLKDTKYFSRIRKVIKKSKVSDFFSRASEFALHHISGAFGNSAGSIKWRKGRLFKNQLVLNEIYSKLKPLDIITEKAGFALTDTFIPGHFGHNAIWLGTKKELIELGLWETVIPENVKKQIEQGKLIIETDRSGTHLKSLEDFMNVDEFGILRLSENHFSRDIYKKTYEVAFSQLGKTYDFNFDVETTDKLVCSELLYQSFGLINWPTTDYLGRTTISPDNIASLVLYNDSPLELIYYVKGTELGQEYKTIDDLVNDIGFKEINGEFFEPVENCQVRRIKKPGPRRRRTRNSDYINVKECETELNPLNYRSRMINH